MDWWPFPFMICSTMFWPWHTCFEINREWYFGISCQFIQIEPDWTSNVVQWSINSTVRVQVGSILGYPKDPHHPMDATRPSPIFDKPRMFIPRKDFPGIYPSRKPSYSFSQITKCLSHKPDDNLQCWRKIWLWGYESKPWHPVPEVIAGIAVW